MLKNPIPAQPLLRSLVLILWLAPLAARAAHLPFVPTEGAVGERIVQDYVAPARDLPFVLLSVINFLLGVVSVLALAALVYGGFRYIASRGDDREIQTAKGVITGAVIGLVVAGIAAAVVNFVIGAVLPPPT